MDAYIMKAPTAMKKFKVGLESLTTLYQIYDKNSQRTHYKSTLYIINNLTFFFEK